jgi:hypothetical protein
MRFLSMAAIAALIAGSPLSAFAQTTTTTPAAPAKTAAAACKGRAEADCQAPACAWVAPSTTKAGKEKKGYCRKTPKAKKSAKPAGTPAKPAT